MNLKEIEMRFLCAFLSTLILTTFGACWYIHACDQETIIIEVTTATGTTEHVVYKNTICSNGGILEFTDAYDARWWINSTTLTVREK